MKFKIPVSGLSAGFGELLHKLILSESITQKLPISIEPDLVLEPEVRAKAPVCYPQLPYQSQD